MKKMHVLVILAVAVMLSASTAFAYPIATDVYNGLFFRSSEVLLNNDGSNIGGVPTITAGDVFWGVLKLNEITNSDNDPSGQTGFAIWPGVPPAEVTGYFAIQVTDAVAPGATVVLSNGNTVTNPDASQFLFIYAAATGLSGDPNNILQAGEAVRIFEGAANYNDLTQGSALSTATDGSLVSSMSLTYWYNFAPLTPIGVGDVSNAFAGLDYVINPFSVLQVNDPNEVLSSQIVSNNLAGIGENVDIWFNSEINRNAQNPGLTVGPTQPMHFGDNDPAVQFPIAEPSTLLLLGVGLLGFATRRRREK